MNQELSKLAEITKKVLQKSKTSGANLDEVIADISKEASLNKEEIRRVVEWTNTMKQLKLFKTSEDKTVEFDLANSDTILDLIHGDRDIEKTSSHEYRINATGDLRKVANAGGLTKIAYSDYPVDRNTLVKAAFNKKARLEEIKSQLVVEKNISEDKFLEAMSKIASNLDTHYSESFENFEDNARNSVGDKALPYLNVLQKMARVNNERLLRFESKNLIKQTENTELLKSAMAYSTLYNMYNEMEGRVEEVKISWDKRLKNYGRGII